MRIIVAALAVALAGPAFAHSKAEVSTPSDGATVEAVPEIGMSFDKPMRIVSILLTREGEAVRLEERTGMAMTTDFTAAPADALAPGDYEVEWRGMSEDGHPMQGGFGFTVSP